MSRPTQRIESGRRLAALLETSPGSGVFEMDERVRVEAVRLRSDRDVSTATLSVRLDDGFGIAEAVARYHPERRLRVRSDHTESTLRHAIFEGYPSHRLRWDGLAGLSNERLDMTVEHAFERLAREAESQVSGRYVRSGVVGGSWAEQVKLNTALTCVFNTGGASNCSNSPVQVVDRQGTPRTVYVFTTDTDPMAVPWTFARALRYLLWFYVPGHGPVFEGNLFDATEPVVGLDPSGAATIARERVLERALVGQVGGLSGLICESTDVVAALRSWGQGAGIHLTAETVNVGDGGESRFRVWANDEGPVCPLYLARGGVDASGNPFYDVANKTVRETVRENEVYRADAVRSEAVGVADETRARDVVGDCAIPWLDFSFQIGDRISGIEGRGVRLATTAELAKKYPSVVGKRYALSGGRYETVLELNRAIG